jgi:multidrug efflux system outer membrane protein
VASYFDWQTYVSQLQIARAELESLQQETTVLQARERAGLARGDELQQLELSRLSMTDQLGNYEASRDASQAALAALLRQTPASLSTSAVHALPAVVASLPADASIDLMARRPDLKARRLQVDYAVANVEVARAGFLPDLNLSAVLGLSSLELGKLLEAGSAAPQLSAAIHLPLFDADKTRALHTQQRATLRAAVADYDGALISAAQEINTALATRAAAATQLRLRDEQLRAGEQLRQLAAARLDGGLTDQLPVLALDRRLLELRAARLTTQHAQLRVDLDLIRALGGGYGSN